MREAYTLAYSVEARPAKAGLPRPDRGSSCKMASEAETKAPGVRSTNPSRVEGAAASHGEPESGRLGGASADFVASLGRKVADARVVLSALQAAPAGRGPRDELRRRMHALGAAARMLRFDAMARSIAEAMATLEQVAKNGTAAESDIARLAQTLDDLPALAWSEAAPREADLPEPSSVPAQPQAPLSALILGADSVADALTEEGEFPFFECERTEDAQAALGLTRSFAPDVVVVDSDIEGSLELVETLLDDPLTEPVPLIVLGTFRAAEHAARFVALGVAKTLTKPVSPVALRRACQDVIDQREGRTVRVTLGEPTLEQLGERLAEEVRRALVDAVDAKGRACRIPLGEGTEVLGAVWGAIARVREVVTMRTEGAVRFTGGGPEGAIALAPWLHQEVAGADRSLRRGRGAAADVQLDKRVVVVADDDPGVTWFIADLLRTTGCVVHEALDGKSALELAYRHSPHLVVSDILMPGLDGFALCRAIRRDVALRDVPVILLSWKEDLLQRVRELGASAAAYLRKESDARAIVARVREVLRPRARIEARLSTEGEVRGRLDDLTTYTLLGLVCATRPNSRISVRDASFLYEVEVREGAPRQATRTAGDGSVQHGGRVLAGVLGVGAGRFVVAPSTSAIEGRELAGTLEQQLAGAIALARAATAATTGARTINVASVSLDEDIVAAYLLATPQPARDIIRRIAAGASPRDMLLKGEVAPSLVEDVLADLAARGAILAVRDPRGGDLLENVAERQSDSVPTARLARTPSSAAASAPTSEVAARDLPATMLTGRAKRPSSPAVAEPVPSSSPNGESPPSSLEDAVMRAMSDRSPVSSAPISTEHPPIVEPSELRPRSSNPPADLEGQPTGSFPPDAIVPGGAASDAPPGPAHDSSPSIPVSVDSSAELPLAATDKAKTAERSKTVLTRGPSDPRGGGAPPTPLAPAVPLARGGAGAAVAPHGERRWGWYTMFVVVIVVVAAGIRWCAATPSTTGDMRTPFPAGRPQIRVASVP
jgi:DNA-binding response OmpR family regulator